MRRKARLETQRLFLRLFRSRNKNFVYQDNDGVIEVNYAERFGTGKFCVSVTAPVGHMRIADIVRIAEGHRGSSAIINSRKRVCLRIMFVFPDIKSGDDKKSLERAQSVARWAEKEFGMQSIISSTGGVVGMRWRLHALK